MIYNLAYLSLKPNTLGPVLAALPAAAPKAAGGIFLGCFLCEFGALNRVAVLTGYADLETCLATRETAGTAGAAYAIAPQLAAFEQLAMKPLPFVGDITPGAHGPFYEIRTYRVGDGGMDATEQAWEKGIEPRRALSPLLSVMATAEDAPSTLVHIWTYHSLDERARVRAKASADRIWPAAGTSDHLLSLRSELFMPMGFSPLK